MVNSCFQKQPVHYMEKSSWWWMDESANVCQITTHLHLVCMDITHMHRFCTANCIILSHTTQAGMLPDIITIWRRATGRQCIWNTILQRGLGSSMNLSCNWFPLILTPWVSFGHSCRNCSYVDKHCLQSWGSLDGEDRISVHR